MRAAGRAAAACVTLVVTLVVAALGLAHAAPAPRAVGFEHNLHARDLAVSGGEPLACVRCHAMTGGMLVGKPGHAACFGACHGKSPAAADKPGDRLAVCTACHAEAALVAAGARAPAVPYPPYTIEPNFAITVGHRRHRELACATCHAAGKPAPHRRCAGCHDGGRAPGHGPAMTSCTGCHTAATGTPLPPTLLPAEINVTGAFARSGHARHAARGGDGGRCVTCHRAVLETDDNVLPAPSAATCATARCHDGAAAFAITVACTRCHLDPNQPGLAVARPVARYSHAAHATRVAPTSPTSPTGNAAVQPPCATCHPLTRSGEVTVIGHAPCIACHADDFGRRNPTICGACHNGTEPWRQLVADRGPPERTEFGATLDHAKHTAACTTCHVLTTPARQLRPPRGHRACTGAACHAVTAGPAPRLSACEACHRTGLAVARQTARLAAPWSVRTAFHHASHATDRDGAPLACQACHVDLGAPDVTTLATPPKRTCAPCHDGTTSFKLTGTTCTRCHKGTKP